MLVTQSKFVVATNVAEYAKLNATMFGCLQFLMCVECVHFCLYLSASNVCYNFIKMEYVMTQENIFMEYKSINLQAFMRRF